MRWGTPVSRIALVGGNGQGKTTIVKLITRLYEPTSGQILLDGVDLRDYEPERSVSGEDQRGLPGFHAI